MQSRPRNRFALDCSGSIGAAGSDLSNQRLSVSIPVVQNRKPDQRKASQCTVLNVVGVPAELNHGTHRVFAAVVRWFDQGCERFVHLDVGGKLPAETSNKSQPVCISDVIFLGGS